MGFLSTLRHLLTDHSHVERSEESLERFRNAWGLDDEAAVGGNSPTDQVASEYDRTQWRRKLHHIFEKDPASDAEWPTLMREAKALNLDDAWVDAAMREEFTMMIRSLIADRRLSEDDQERLDAVRKRMEMTEEEAAALVQSVVADARRFFGGDVIVEH